MLRVRQEAMLIQGRAQESLLLAILLIDRTVILLWTRAEEVLTRRNQDSLSLSIALLGKLTVLPVIGTISVDANI